MFDEEKHPRDEAGKFTESDTEKLAESLKLTITERRFVEKKTELMTPKEKIASVHIYSTKDNILPELNEDSLAEMGLTQNKKVLVKASTIARNAERHPDVKREEYARIIGETLYDSTFCPFKANPEKPYFSFAKPMKISLKDGSQIYGITILDVDMQKEYFEVVHWHWVREKNFKGKK